MKTLLRSALFVAVIGPTPTLAQGIGAAEARDLRARIEANLVDELTRLWYPRSLDPDGAFHQTYARDWSALPDENRFLVYQARMTWTAAAFARHSPGHREAFAGYARRGIAYLDKSM